MAFTGNFMCTSFKKELLEAVHNFLLSGGDTFKIALYDNNASFTAATAGAEDGTTWLSTNASVSMLYGSLIEAYTFMKGEADLVQNYTQRFTEALSRVKNFGESQEVTDAYRTGLILREKT